MWPLAGVPNAMLMPYVQQAQALEIRARIEGENAAAETAREQERLTAELQREFARERHAIEMELLRQGRR